MKTTLISEENLLKWRESSTFPVKCPECQSNNLNYDEKEDKSDGTYLVKGTLICNDCGVRWDEFYKYSHIKDLNIPANLAKFAIDYSGKKSNKMHDITLTITRSGLYCVIKPWSQRAIDWIKENENNKSWQCSTHYIEPDYIENLATEAKKAGLTVLVY